MSVFGHEPLWGAELAIPAEDRATHMAVIGQTGTGKTNLLHHLIHQDIAQNRGVAVIDPHGRLVRDVLRNSIPPSREDDVVILDITNLDHPPPFNLLAVPGAVERTNAVVLLLAVFEKLYPDFSGRMVDTFSMALQTSPLWRTRPMSSCSFNPRTARLPKGRSLRSRKVRAISGK
jgi:hypothetical protein